MPTNFEYKTISLETDIMGIKGSHLDRLLEPLKTPDELVNITQQKFCELGREGWELSVSFKIDNSTLFTFKRPRT